MTAGQRFIKRVADIFFATIGLIISSPLFLLISVLIKLDSPGPALFLQQRLGKNGTAFTLYKFRSMFVNVPDIRNCDGSTFNAEDDPRLTPLGRFLRKTSVDELPQLLNVLKGEMSLVGPRPDQLDHLDFYAAEDRRKLAMKPGLTSLAMIRGRNSLPWKERIRLEVWYVEHYSLWLDVKIMLKTVPVLLLRQGVYIEPQALSLKGEDHE